MEDHHYDVVVIGTGPGGEGAAMQAAKHCKTVAVVERAFRVGGSCTHVATIPSKALRFVIFQMTEANSNKVFREAGVSFRLEFPDLRKTAKSVIDQQVEMRQTFYERNHVPVYRGQGCFVDAHTLDVVDEEETRHRVCADSFVLAVGARPYRPPDVDFKHPRIFDNETILNLSFTPQSITIYGAGIIGCEYASIFRNLGVKVNLVNTRDKLLEFLDDEITDALAYHMRERGVLIRHREEFLKAEGHDDCVITHLKSGKQLKTDVLLYANGRTGNTDHMGLDKIGVVPDSRGNLKVNDDFQTSVPHIYAVGDVIGYPALASAAYVQGRYAASHILGQAGDRTMVTNIPTGIYTSPEISSIGQTERQLTEAKVPYEVGHSLFRSLARAQITGQTTGMLKLLFHRETLEVLGVHCFGQYATEIIHIGQSIMSQPPPHNTLMYFINATFNYPTMAEAYRVAALNGYNRVC